MLGLLALGLIMLRGTPLRVLTFGVESIDGVHTNDRAGSGKPNPLAC